MPVSPYQMVTTAAGTIAIARVISRRAQGGRRMSRKPSITIWPASVAVTVEFSPQHSSAIAEQRRRDGGAEQRREQRVRLAEFGDVGLAGLVEGRGREDQDRGVDQQREHQRDGRSRWSRA